MDIYFLRIKILCLLIEAVLISAQFLSSLKVVYISNKEKDH